MPQVTLSRRQALQLSVMLSGAAFAACSSAPPDAAPPADAPPPIASAEIRVAHAWDDAFWSTQEAFDQQFQARHPDLQVIAENTPWGEFLDKYLAAAAADTLPDILYCQYAWAQRFIGQGVFMNHQPYIEAQLDFDLDDFTKPSLVSYQKEGDLYVIPYDEGPLLLYWNVDLFDAAGVPHPTPDWTMAELLNAAISLTKGAGAEKIYGFAGLPYPDGAMNATYLYPFGAKFWNEPAENECHLDTPEAIAALTWWLDLAHEYAVSPTPADSTLGGGAGGFAAGRVAMFQQGTWFTPTLTNRVQFRWDLAHWPHGPSAHTTATMGSGYAITKAAQQPDLAWIYEHEYLSTAGQIFMWGATGRGSPSRISAWDAYLASPHAPPSAQVALEALTTYGVHDVLDTVNGPAITNVAGPIWDRVLLGELEIASAVAQITADLQPVLAQNHPA